MSYRVKCVCTGCFFSRQKFSPLVSSVVTNRLLQKEGAPTLHSIMSHEHVIVLNSDSDEEVEQAEIGGAFAVVFCMFLRSHRLLAERERATQSRNLNAWFFRIFKRLSFPACLHSFWFTSRPTRAQRARENDAEGTETWRVIDSGANERSRFVFSRSLSRLGSVALLVRFFFFSTHSRLHNKKHIDTTQKTTM